MNNVDLTYEEAMSKLELILKELEEDNCTLDESIKKFKDGVQLYNYCNELLNRAEGEIKILLEDEKGELLDEEFPMEG